MDIRIGFVPVRGTSIYYEVAGSGPPVVLLHGFALDHRIWRDVVPSLARFHQVVYPDLRGFGQSALGSGAYSHSDDMAALMDQFEIEQAVVVGLGLGGGLAVDFALSHGSRVRALVVVDGALGGHAWSAEYAELMKRIRRAAVDSGVARARMYYLSSPLLDRLAHLPETVTNLHAIVKDYSGWHWAHRDRARALSPPAIGRLAAIAAPTLVLVGEFDMADFHEIAATLEARIPGARKVVLQGVGHVPLAEDPELFNETLLAFLREVCGT